MTSLLNDMGWEAVANLRLRRLEQVNAENERLRQVEAMARYVLEKFQKDEAQGYRSRDRQFAIEMLGKFLTVEQV